MSANPNVLEMLGSKDDHYLIKTDIGQDLLDNKDMFITQRVVGSFGGYANAQLRRLQNALARDNYPQSEKEKHILDSILNQMRHFEDNYTLEHGIELFIDKSDKDDYENEIFMTVNNFRYPLRDFKAIWSEMNNVVKDYSKLNNRNKKKDELHLNKHIQHLFRLYIMAIEILEGKGINTYREFDKDFLLRLRHGYYVHNDDYSYIYYMLDEFVKRFEYAKKHTELPYRIDMKRVEEFVIESNRKIILSS